MITKMTISIKNLCFDTQLTQPIENFNINLDKSWIMDDIWIRTDYRFEYGTLEGVFNKEEQCLYFSVVDGSDSRSGDFDRLVFDFDVRTIVDDYLFVWFENDFNDKTKFSEYPESVYYSVDNVEYFY